eukprot:4875000-Prymnesium_polylepis.1
MVATWEPRPARAHAQVRQRERRKGLMVRREVLTEPVGGSRVRAVRVLAHSWGGACFRVRVQSPWVAHDAGEAVRITRVASVAGEAVWITWVAHDAGEAVRITWVAHDAGEA